MIPAPKTANEQQRIAALYDYDLLDTLPEKVYDDVTRIAADVCGVPISLISLIDNDRQWFKSKVGLDVTETHRDLAFCAHAILTPEEMFVVDNPAEDKRFHDNPLVTGAPHIAFYAGVPLVTNSGDALGTLCVIDNKPNQLSKEQRETLKALARQIIAYFEVRRMNTMLNIQKAEIEELNNDLSQFVYVAAHDMKSPCNSLAMSATYLKDNYADVLDDEGKQFLTMMEETAYAATNMINGILQHTQTVNKTEVDKENFTFLSLTDEVRKMLIIPDGFSFTVENGDLQLFAGKYILVQVLLNLCNNAIKYNHRHDGCILLSATDNGAYYTFSVTDNGPGIKPDDQLRIFDMFRTLGKRDRYNKTGTGIGLSTVKRIVEKLNGSISVFSEPGNGSRFEFTIGK